MSSPRRLAAIACGAALLAACAAGPEFTRPEPPKVSAYDAGEPVPAAIASTTGEPAQRIAPENEMAARWWELFRSPVLDEVVRQALAGNRSLAAAHATLAAAQETANAARGALFPQLDANAAAERRGTGALTANLYTLGGTVGYSPDLFGAVRRRIEQQAALAENQKYQLAAAWLTLTGNVVNQAVAIGAVRAQIRAAEEVIASDEQNLALVRQELQAGKVARIDVLTAETQLASDRALLPPLRQQLSVARHALAALTGRAPGAWSAPDFALEDFTLPASLPLSLPSQLVRQRPDILAAEAQLHAASAAVGVATAQLYPNLTLTGTFGQQSAQGATLFDSGSRAWSLSANLLAPLFHGGTLEAQRRAAVDAFQASLATWQQTVLQGFQQVADTLQALGHDAELVDAERQVVGSATESLRLQRISYAAGKSTLINLIDAQRVYQQARGALVRAQAQRMQDTAQLFVALGGGWWQGGGLNP